MIALTPRQREIVGLICDRKASTAKAIARELGTSPRTVELQIHRIITKTGAENLTDAIVVILRGES